MYSTGIGLVLPPRLREIWTVPSSALRYRYRGLPAAVLLSQLFLACGWLRVATEHAIDRAWWTGAALTEFLGSSETEASVGLYEPFLANVVARMPAVVAAIVLGIEVVAGLLLALNLHPKWGLILGGFLNVQFALAGVVNPSAFYLILAFAIIQWRMERKLSPVQSWRFARWSALAAGAVALVLVWSIQTMHPDSAMEDPALVLIFLSALFALGTWWTHKRIVAKVLAMKDLGYDRRRPDGPSRQLSR